MKLNFKMVYVKIMIFITCFICLFGLWTVPVNAAELDLPDVNDKPYPYHGLYSFSRDSTYNREDAVRTEYYYSFSAKPIQWYASGDNGYMRYTGKYLYYRRYFYTLSDGSMAGDTGWYLMDGMPYDIPSGASYKDDLVYHAEKLRTSGWLSANHDIKAPNGDLVFRAPLIRPEVVAPLQSQTQNNLMIITGGTICLVVLGVSLMMLSRRFYQFLS